MAWLVVKFQEEDAVEAIPRSWYVTRSEECFWPPSKYSKTKHKDFIKNNKTPEPDWKRYPATILGTYDTLAQAQRKAEKGKNTSDLSSNNEEYRERRHIRKTNRKRSQAKALSDIESVSDTSSVCAASDTNEYPNASHLTPITGTDLSEHSPPIPPGSRPSIKPVTTMTLSNHEPKRSITLDAEFEKQIFREINIMQLKLTDIMDNMALLLKCNRAGTELPMPTNNVPDIIHLFPVDEKSLIDVECWLESDGEHKKVLFQAKELSHIGGSTVKELTRRIMSRVFTNEVGSQYSWEGAKKKKAFKKLAIASTILNAVRLSKTTCDSNEAEVISHIKAWLVRCKDRMKNNPKPNSDNLTERASDKAEVGREDKSTERRCSNSQNLVSDRRGVRADENEVRAKDDEHRFRNTAQARETDGKDKNYRNRTDTARAVENPLGTSSSDDEIVENSVNETSINGN